MIIYATIPQARPEMPNITIKDIAIKNNMSWLILFLIPVLLIFKENIGISEIINNDMINIKTIVM